MVLETIVVAICSAVLGGIAGLLFGLHVGRLYPEGIWRKPVLPKPQRPNFTLSQGKRILRNIEVPCQDFVKAYYFDLCDLGRERIEIWRLSNGTVISFEPNLKLGDACYNSPDNPFIRFTRGSSMDYASRWSTRKSQWAVSNFMMDFAPFHQSDRDNPPTVRGLVEKILPHLLEAERAELIADPTPRADVRPDIAAECIDTPRPVAQSQSAQ